ncbi:MAG TPA: hypothetical protein VND64_24965 [Pirellulales bacterium]|nr:hypothetical protein [Pirellulales bacterium]
METIEQRVTALEKEVADLKKQLPRKDNWVDEIVGSMKDFPEFDEVLRLGAEFRRSQHPPDEP